MKDWQHIISFETWLQEKYGNLDKFYGLTKKDQEKIFLRYKWGYMDERANEGLEINEQGTLRLLGQLVHLVNNVNLKPSFAGRKFDVLTQSPDFINAPVRGSVNFNHIHTP